MRLSPTWSCLVIIFWKTTLEHTNKIIYCNWSWLNYGIVYKEALRVCDVGREHNAEQQCVVEYTEKKKWNCVWDSKITEHEHEHEH